MSLASKLEQTNSPNNFNSKNIYDATRNLVSIRSKSYKKKEKEIDDSGLFM